MKILGILWCDGEDIEKVSELYDCLQGPDDDKIAFDDKDFKPNFNHLLDFASSIVFDNEPKYM